MKNLLKKIEIAMMAAAFAEEGEFEIARQILGEVGSPKNLAIFWGNGGESIS